VEHQIDTPSIADHPRLLDVWEASVRETHHFVPEEKVQHLKKLIVEQQLFHHSEMFCVRDASGKVGGFAGTSGDSLDMLFLHPSMIGTGAGKALMQYAITTKGVTRVDVNEQNEHAREFYEYFGFAVTSRSETDDNGEPFPLLRMKRHRQITIRKITIADLDALLYISNRTYHEAFFEAFNDPDAFTVYTSELFAPDRLKAELADPDIVFCFAMDGRFPVGYIKLNFGNTQTIFQGNDAAEIERIYVLAAYQNQKIGEALLDYAVDIVRDKNLKTLWLGVWENNEKAVRFYERHFFRKFLTHQYFVGNDPQTDFLMKMNL